LKWLWDNVIVTHLKSPLLAAGAGNYFSFWSDNVAFDKIVLRFYFHVIIIIQIQERSSYYSYNTSKRVDIDKGSKESRGQGFEWNVLKI